MSNNSDMVRMLRLVEGQQFAGEPAQKPGDQVRGTDQAAKNGRQHPFHNRLVGEELSLEDKLAKKYQDMKDVHAKEKEQEKKEELDEQGLAVGRKEIATGTPDDIKLQIKKLGLGPARRESTGSGGEAIFVFRNPNYYVSQGQDGNWVLVQTNAELDQQGVAEDSHEEQVSRLAAYNEKMAGENPPIELGLREVGNWAKVGHYGDPIKTAWYNIAKYGIRNNKFNDSVDRAMSAIGDFPDKYDLSIPEIGTLYSAYETVYDQWAQSQGQQGMAEGSLNELSVNTLSSYGKRAEKSNDKKLNKAADHTKKATDLYAKGTASAVDKSFDHEDQANKLHKQVNKRDAGMDRAAAKLGNKFKKGVAEGGTKDRQWSNKDMERLRVATRDFDDIMASDGPDQTKHDLIKKRIQTKPLAGPKGVLPEEQGVAEGHDDHNPVVSAISRRVLHQRLDLLQKYGVTKVMSAIDEVADFVGDVEEIGSSDVSGWIRHVERTLGNMGELAEADVPPVAGTTPPAGTAPAVTATGAAPAQNPADMMKQKNDQRKAIQDQITATTKQLADLRTQLSSIQ